jgi:integrase
MNTVHSIRIVKVDAERFCISIIFNGKRYRYYSGKPINSNLAPNSLLPKHRKAAFQKLLFEFQKAIQNDWTPESKTQVNQVQHPISQALRTKQAKAYSKKYLNHLNWVVSKIPEHFDHKNLNASELGNYLNSLKLSPASYNNIRAHLMSLETEMKEFGYIGQIKDYCKRRRAIQQLHKPFKNVQAVLSDIYAFDKRLHLCCLLSFGCLLRPHREIRELTWGEIASNLDQISLSGSRNKGKRNRIVPIPAYIKPYLEEFARIDVHTDINVFTGAEYPYSPDFFKGLWTKYKKQSKLLEKDQTLYSFRHTGAIQVYEKTGSLTKLQQAMGHSNLQVSLTYLRGLEVRQLDQNDMPSIF